MATLSEWICNFFFITPVTKHAARLIMFTHLHFIMLFLMCVFVDCEHNSLDFNATVISIKTLQCGDNYLYF